MAHCTQSELETARQSMAMGAMEPAVCTDSIRERVRQTQILLVGAGGVGSELLKCLMLTGFGEIHVVDLDTIELSNLNRQFLFRPSHIRKPKATTACEVAQEFNPSVRLHPYHANIKETRFSARWFREFDIVFNALDNIDARRHVNTMCVMAGKPLIESGTSGLVGQSQIIIPGRTECYDCNPKETPKTFPVCTIRSTPSQPIHCIVWAKTYLFNLLFGNENEEAVEIDHSEGENEEMLHLKEESEALKTIRNSMNSPSLPEKAFQKVFQDDIIRLLSMEDMWKNRTPPKPISYHDFAALKTDPAAVLANDQTAWTKEENFFVFCDSLLRLRDRFCAEKAAVGIEFDKDDIDALDFVTSAANLRCDIYNIERKSRFDMKQIAGNIIPAVATSNAVIAGTCVLSALKMLGHIYGPLTNVFLGRREDRIFITEKVRPPNPSCLTCGIARATIKVDIQRATLGSFVKLMLQDHLNYTEEISVIAQNLLYDIEEQENNDRTFYELGLVNGTLLTILDEASERPRVNLQLEIEECMIPIKSDLAFELPALTVPCKVVSAAQEDEPDDQASTNGVSDRQQSPVCGHRPSKRVKTVQDAQIIDDITDTNHQSLLIMLD